MIDFSLPFHGGYIQSHDWYQPAVPWRIHSKSWLISACRLMANIFKVMIDFCLPVNGEYFQSRVWFQPAVPWRIHSKSCLKSADTFKIEYGAVQLLNHSISCSNFACRSMANTLKSIKVQPFAQYHKPATRPFIRDNTNHVYW